MSTKTQGGITPDLSSRLRLLGLVFAVMLAVRALGAVVRHLTAPDKPLGMGGDFAAFWATGRLAVEGRAVEAFLPEVAHPLQYEAIAQDTLLLWHYPPTWTLLVTPFGTLPYFPALMVFLMLSAALWYAAMRWLLPGMDPWARAAFTFGPAVAVSLGQGQNGLLSGACLILAAGAVLRGDWRLPGFGAAALLFKPHLGVLIPLAWIARGRWGAFAAAAAMGAVFLAVSTWVFGLDYWRAFLANGPALAEALRSGSLWDQQVSVYAMLARLGVPNDAALWAQVAVAVIVIAMAWQTFRQTAAPRLSAAMLLFAAPAVPPYSFHYDLPSTLPALALLFLDRERAAYGRGEAMLLVAIFCAPPFHRILSVETGLSLMAPLLLAGTVLIWRRARAAGV